jgi:hypothetical protein
MVREGDRSQPLPVRLERQRAAGVVLVGTRADRADPGVVEVLERVGEGLGSVVERVVVGERYAVDPQIRKGLGRDGWGTEVKDAVRRRRAPLGNAALEVDDHEVGVMRRVDDLRCKEGFGAGLGEPPSDLPPQHRVTREREPHRESHAVRTGGRSGRA